MHLRSPVAAQTPDTTQRPPRIKESAHLAEKHQKIKELYEQVLQHYDASQNLEAAQPAKATMNKLKAEAKHERANCQQCANELITAINQLNKYKWNTGGVAGEYQKQVARLRLPNLTGHIGLEEPGLDLSLVDESASLDESVLDESALIDESEHDANPAAPKKGFLSRSYDAFDAFTNKHSIIWGLIKYLLIPAAITALLLFTGGLSAPISAVFHGFNPLVASMTMYAATTALISLTIYLIDATINFVSSFKTASNTSKRKNSDEDPESAASLAQRNFELTSGVRRHSAATLGANDSPTHTGNPLSHSPTLPPTLAPQRSGSQGPLLDVDLGSRPGTPTSSSKAGMDSTGDLHSQGKVSAIVQQFDPNRPQPTNQSGGSTGVALGLMQSHAASTPPKSTKKSAASSQQSVSSNESGNKAASTTQDEDPLWLQFLPSPDKKPKDQEEDSSQRSRSPSPAHQ
jgi:hypothetical protein